MERFMAVKYIFVVPDNLGKFLFNDITALKNCEVIVVKRSLWGKVFLGKRSLFAKIIGQYGQGVVLAETLLVHFNQIFL